MVAAVVGGWSLVLAVGVVPVPVGLLVVVVVGLLVVVVVVLSDVAAPVGRGPQVKNVVVGADETRPTSSSSSTTTTRCLGAVLLPAWGGDLRLGLLLLLMLLVWRLYALPFVLVLVLVVAFFFWLCIFLLFQGGTVSSSSSGEKVGGPIGTMRLAFS